MIVEGAIVLASVFLFIVILSSHNELSGWILVEWPLMLVSVRHWWTRRLAGRHTCRQYVGVRDVWSDDRCTARVHYLQQRETPQPCQSESVDEITFFMTNSNNDWITVGLRRSSVRPSVLLNLGLGNHGLFQHPKHPSSRVVIRPDSFEAGDLKIELLEPQRKWRIAYNGWLRKGILSPENDYDETAGEFVHVRFYFIWEAFTNQFDLDLDLDSLARTRAYGLGGIDKHSLSSARTEQFGELHGHVWVDGDKQHVRMRGSKLRQYVPSPESGLRDEIWTVRHYISLETGVSISVSLVRNSASGPYSSVCVGAVMMPIGGWATVTCTSLTLDEFFSDSDHMEYTFYLYAGGQKYRVHVKCHASATVQDTVSHDHVDATCSPHDHVDVTCVRPFTVTVNEWKGTGVLYIRHDAPNDHPDSPSSAPKPPHHTVTSSLPSVTEEEPLILRFSDPWCRRPELVGGKGASLAELTQAGGQVNVPAGLCVTVTAFQRHLSDNEELSQTVESLIKASSGDLEAHCGQVAHVFDQTTVGSGLREEILTNMAAMFGVGWAQGRRLAVRSSAVGEDGSDLSCAGQMDTLLGVKGQSQLFAALVKCWSSQYSYQAVQYRRQHGQSMRTSMCVVIQEMVNAQISGVLFTRDPITGDPSRIIVNASYGLGEAVVSGVSEPDTIVLARSPAGDVSVHSQITGRKQVTMSVAEEGGMTSSEVEDGESSACISHQVALRLGRIGVQLERHYGDARDVEWAVNDDVIYILQARPITSIDTFTDEECMEEFDLPLATERAWLTTGNIGEMSPGALTPLSLSVFMPACEQLMSSLGPRKVENLSYDTTSYLGRCVGATSNHLFINFYGLFQCGENHSVVATSQGAQMAVVGHLVDGIHTNEVREYTGRSPWWKRVYTFYMQQRARGSAHERTAWWEQQLKTYDINASDARSLYKLIQEKLPDYIEVWMDTGMCTSKSGVASNALVGVLANNNNFDWRPEHFSDAAKALERCDNVYSADVPTAMRVRGLHHLVEMGAAHFNNNLSDVIRESGHSDEFLAMNDTEAVSWLEAPSSGRVHELYTEFLSRHGHRCVREAEFRETSWRTEPTKLVPSIKMMLRTGGVAAKQRTQMSADQIMTQLKTTLNFKQRFILRRLIPWARRAVGEREWGKSVSICMCDKFKQAYWRLGRHLADEGYLPDQDLVFFLTNYELGQLLDTRPPQLVTKAVKRRRLLTRMADLRFPVLSRGHPQPEMQFYKRPLEGDVSLTGVPVSQGVVSGVARVVKTLPDAHTIQEGDVLLVPYTDVGWTPYFPLISGLVTEIGSILSHGAVVAREYGLPCIVNCNGATDVFQSGDRVLLDATQGLLTKIVDE